MSVYPSDLDDDSTIIRIDDNITEQGGETINQLRDAVFKIQAELGINPSGSQSSVLNRLNVSLDSVGNIKQSALTAVGLVTLPIDNAQVGTNAGIQESKLALDFSTSSLRALISGNATLLNTVATTVATSGSDFSKHLVGGPAANLRHVASHIDINDVPTDSRDTSFTWSGIVDKDGAQYAADNVAEALVEIAGNLGDHQNETTAAHAASAISVDTSSFTTLETTSDTVQKALDNIDDNETLNLGMHRTTMHSNGVPRDARSQLLLVDGYAENVVPVTSVNTYLAHNPPGTVPVDDVYLGDNVVKFNPGAGAAQYLFESKFSQVKPGDIITINYGNGLEASYEIDSTRFVLGSEWYVRLNGTNLDEATGYARIDRPLFDDQTHGILAVASANATPAVTFPNIRGSLIVADPKGACALGLGFDPNQIDDEHYKLYLQFYPTGTPSEKTLTLPYIDVTGNAGATPGAYTLENIVQATNDKFREAGYNYRFIAYASNGNFGIMLADSIDGASFSIISGDNSSGTLAEGVYTENVVGDTNPDLAELDGLGLGANNANVASPAYQSSFVDSTAALLPTKIFVPKRRRDYIVNGIRYDELAPAANSNANRYWVAEITNRNATASTVEVTYTVEADLRDSELLPGKTIVVAPTVAFTSPSYYDVDYGRFIIKTVNFSVCPGAQTTEITVINGLAHAGTPVAFSSPAGLAVRLYFSEDSTAVDEYNLIDTAPAGTYLRHHEIFVTDTKKTFTHERARLDATQVESSRQLAAANWNITDVAPKLRGFRDSDTTFNKYVRFYVLNYNSTTGEYDGYIGRRNPLNYTISEYGEIVRARKNIPTRFYDATNVDYIELLYDEPGTAASWIMSANSARYIDIELFPSLALDDELLLLASCEINANTVSQVISRKQTGSISELEFTDSAIDFIESGDRLLHANGVLRGLSYRGPDPNDSSVLIFNGGTALVNGHISTINDGTIRIPEVRSTASDTVEWAICVNDEDQFEAIIVTSSKTHFFVSNIAPAYYLPSVSYTELINQRKDLTPIAIVSVNISSFTLNSVTDIRKFIGANTINLPLTLVRPDTRPNTGSADEDFIGNFESLGPLMWWLDHVDSTRKVRVQGAVEVNSSVDFNGLGTIIFDGEGEGSLTFNDDLAIGNADLYFKDIDVAVSSGTTVTASSGAYIYGERSVFVLYSSFVMGNSAHFKNCEFYYYPTTVGPSSTNNIINADLGGCLSFTYSGTQNVAIENCNFISSTAHRPPFICVYVTDSSLPAVSNFAVKNCYFYDSSATDHCAIVIGGRDNEQPWFYNVNIEGNKCSDYQSIVIASEDTDGVSCSDCNIRNNMCGIIGVWVYTEVINIEGNEANGILQPVVLDPTNSSNSRHWHGSSSATLASGTGAINISNNYLNGVIGLGIASDSVYHTNIHIIGNTVTANTGAILTTWGYDGGAGVTTTTRIGIAIYSMDGSSANFDKSFVTIADNSINGVGSWTFSAGIYNTANANIVNNTICGFTSFGLLVYAKYAGSLINIRGNILDREGDTVTAYIYVDGVGTQGGGIVADNIIDSWDVGSGDMTDAIQTGEEWVVERNKNHRQTMTMRAKDIGRFNDGNAAFVDEFLPGATPTSELASFVLQDQDVSEALFVVNSGDSASVILYDLVWNLLPFGTTLINVSVNYSGINTGYWVSTSPITLKVYEPGGIIDTQVGSTASGELTVSATGTLTLSPAIASLRSSRPYVKIEFDAEAQGGDRSLAISALIATYQW